MFVYRPNLINNPPFFRLISSMKKMASERENGVKFILWQEAFQSNLNVRRSMQLKCN